MQTYLCLTLALALACSPQLPEAEGASLLPTAVLRRLILLDDSRAEVAPAN